MQSLGFLCTTDFVFQLSGRSEKSFQRISFSESAENPAGPKFSSRMVKSPRKTVRILGSSKKKQNLKTPRLRAQKRTRARKSAEKKKHWCTRESRILGCYPLSQFLAVTLAPSLLRQIQGAEHCCTEGAPLQNCSQWVLTIALES